MLWAGSCRTVCRVCHQQQTDVPGKAPLQEEAEISQRLQMRMNDLTAWPLLEQLAPLKTGAGSAQSCCMLLGGRLLIWHYFGKCGFLPTGVYQLAPSCQRPSVRVSVIPPPPQFIGFVCWWVFLWFSGGLFFTSFSQILKKIYKEERTFLETTCPDCCIGNLGLKNV